MSGKPLVGSLKAQKVRQKGRKVNKNVLLLSEDSFWPLVEDEEAKKINLILTEDLNVIKNSKPRVPWYILMKLTKEQRKDQIEEEINKLSNKEKDQISLSNKARKYVAIGVNSCLRLIDQGKLLFCLLDSSVQPKLLIDKIISLSKEKQVLLALIPNLSETLNSTFGFKTFILGFKKTIDDDDDCPIKGSLRIYEILNKLNIKPWSKINQDIGEIKSSNETGKIIQERLSDIYLYRTDKNERVFHPSPTTEISTDFIQLSSESHESHQKDKRKFEFIHKSNRFQSPKILTVQNNPNKKRKNKKNKVNKK